MRSTIFRIAMGIMLFILNIGMTNHDHEVWGFYGHRLINRTAVFTLPVELIPLYKSNIDYITEQSVAPDKRRHASPLEAIRHYIDLDHWGANPLQQVPRDLHQAIMHYGGIYVLDMNGDTVISKSGEAKWEILPLTRAPHILHEIQIYQNTVMEVGRIPLPAIWCPMADSIGGSLHFADHFSSQGILPYHLLRDQKRLRNAFYNKDWASVLRVSAEIGHYISDAHVPLHTTENYNGQMTGQDGIHAFWESRLPELFANGEYDLFTGRAKYIEDIPAYVWQIVAESHALVDEVLYKEKELSKSFARDEQYCYEFRGSQQVRQACEAYARAYQDAMNDMVEHRMRASIAAVGSIWYTSWVDAGRPNIEIVTTDMIQDIIIDNTQSDGAHIEDP